MIKKYFYLGAAIFFLSITILASPSNAQCNKACIQTVKGLISEQKHHFYTTWLEKSNLELGDAVTIALSKIYTKSAIVQPRNVKLYLPVIRVAFEGLSMVRVEENKSPSLTLPFLKSLRRKLFDPGLKKEIQELIDEITKSTAK